MESIILFFPDLSAGLFIKKTFIYFSIVSLLFINLNILYAQEVNTAVSPENEVSAAGTETDKNNKEENNKKTEDVLLDNVVVAATRTERKTSEIPASVSVIDQETIKDSKMMNIKDAMIGTPGVLIESNNQGYDSRLIIRGAGLKAPYGIREIMILLDGIPITDPDSFSRLDFIDTQMIERIEIVKGPSSTLWGANASGGVINIITKNPRDIKGGEVKVSGGSFETFSAHTAYSNDIYEKLYYTFSYSHRESDNTWRRRNDFNSNQGSFRGSYVFDDGSFVESSFSYTRASLQLPGSLDEDMFKKYLDSGKADESDGPWQHSGRYSEIYFTSLRYNKTIGSFDLKPMLYGNFWTHTHPVTGKINDSDTKTYGVDFQLNHNHKSGRIKGTSTAGVTLRYDDQDTDYYKYKDIETSSGRIVSTLSDKKGDKMEVETRKTSLYGAYFQETLRIYDRFILDAGIRYDSIKFDISGTTWSEYSYGSGRYNDIDETENSTDKTYKDISPRFGLVYKITEAINSYCTVSQGIKTPSESEITANPDLKIVKVYNYEAGIKTRYNIWSMDTSVYYSPVKDEVIVVHQDDEDYYVNAGKTEKKGVEVSAMADLPFHFYSGVNYSYADYKFDKFMEPVTVRTGSTSTTTNEDRSGNSLPFIPKHQYSLFAGLRHPAGYKFRIQTYTWGEYYMDNANSEKYEGYEFITNAMIGYEKENWEISLMADNLLNKHYATEAEKNTAGKKTYVPAAPFSIMLRGSITF